jgi:hypothetical protein
VSEYANVASGSRRCRSMTPPPAPSWPSPRRRWPRARSSRWSPTRSGAGAHGGDLRRHHPASANGHRSRLQRRHRRRLVDVYITDPAVDITTLSSPTFSFTSSTSVQASTSRRSALLSRRRHLPHPRHRRGQPFGPAPRHPGVLLLNQRVATVILTPTTGGTLANGSVLIEEGPTAPAVSTPPPPHQRPGAPGRRGHERRLGLGPRRQHPIGTNVVAPAVGTMSASRTAARSTSR